MVYDIGIIGGGIVGAATFYQLQKRFPQYNIILIEIYSSKPEESYMNCSEVRIASGNSINLTYSVIN